MRQLPSHYVLSKFYTHAGEPFFRKGEGTYNASCPICREGKSWLKKKRLYFYPHTNTFYCFNCNKSWNSFKWIQECTGLTKEEIENEIVSEDCSVDITSKFSSPKLIVKNRATLPYDSINLLDDQQKNFYKNNTFFQKAQDYIKERKIDTAINRCSHYYISLTDKIHANRLCIPYLNSSNKTVFYQTRSLDNSEPRYLNKIGAEKTIFGIDRLDKNFDKIFIFEGPIDAMFVKNGVCLAGLNLTNSQHKQFLEYPFHEKIWILDNPQKDKAAKDKIFQLLHNKEKVFKWPINSPFKDFNEWAVRKNLNEIPPDYILNSLYI
jgi:DNA primase